MSTFIFTYRVPEDFPVAGPELQSAWQAYLDSLGSHLVDAGNPVFERATVGGSVTETLRGGYSIVTAANLKTAIELAEACPFVGAGGGVEVGELTLLSPGSVSTTAADHARKTGLS